MTDSDIQNVNQLVDHLFRHEAGRITSILTGIFGLHNMDLAEDIVQETLLDALKQWSVGGIPDNPPAWLMQVAKRKTINSLKRHEHARKHLEHQLTTSSTEDIDQVFLDNEIKDSQLKMIFACCHPELPRESQIALTLKTLGGFSVPEIAHALLTTTANINKRLYRAKQKFREDNIQFELPIDESLHVRLKSVYLNLYLLFNEGYNSSHNEQLIHEDLCVEAIRLLQILTEHMPNQPIAYALLSLMYLHAARFEARLDQQGGIIIFQDQDRSLWDRDMINTGVYYLNKSSSGNELSEYHIEAGIAAQHCLSESYVKTNWKSLYKQYELLLSIKKNPIIELNLAIIISKTEGLTASIQRLKKLEKSNQLKEYYLLPATLATFYLETGNKKDALKYFIKAKQLTKSNTELKFLEEKIKELT